LQFLKASGKKIFKYLYLYSLPASVLQSFFDLDIKRYCSLNENHFKLFKIASIQFKGSLLFWENHLQQIPPCVHSDLKPSTIAAFLNSTFFVDLKETILVEWQVKRNFPGKSIGHEPLAFLAIFH